MFDNLPIQFGPYKLMEKIGQGGMAEIFRAESRGTGTQDFVKEVAIKRILASLASNEDFVTQFLDEARIAGSLSHPNIVQIYDVGQVDEAYYIAMEYVNGKHLGQVIRSSIEQQHPFPVHLATSVIKEVAQALSFAHSAKDSLGNPLNIIHRDISPQNILVDFHGAIKLTDFGIAKAANKLFQTTAGVIKGKFSYLAPEQLIGQASSPASDLFSLGVVMWEMLSGRRLFQGESDIKTIQLVQACDIPPIGHFRSDISSELDDIIRNLLASSPQYRYQDAGMLVRDLSYFLTNSGHSEGPAEISHFMGSLYPDLFPTTGTPPTKASLPAISMDDLLAQNLRDQGLHLDDEQTNVGHSLPGNLGVSQDVLSEFTDAKTPVATNHNEQQPLWEDGPATAIKRPTDASDFEDIRTAAIDMSPLLAPNAFQESGGLPPGLLAKAAQIGDDLEETAALLGDASHEHQIDDAPTVGPTPSLYPLDPPTPAESPAPNDATNQPPPPQDTPTKTNQPETGQTNAGNAFGLIVGLLVLLLLGMAGTFAYIHFQQPSHGTVDKNNTPPPQSTNTTLQVAISPPNAKVTLNGYKMEGTPKLRIQKGLVAGLTYQVYASSGGYRPVKKIVSPKGAVMKISIALIRLKGKTPPSKTIQPKQAPTPRRP